MTLLVRGIDWSNPTAPRIRCVDDTTSATTFFTHDSVLRFSVDETKGRRCLGWRDLTAEGPGHSPCDRGATVTAGRQCDRCRNREGFTTVHQAHVSARTFIRMCVPTSHNHNGSTSTYSPAAR